MAPTLSLSLLYMWLPRLLVTSLHLLFFFFTSLSFPFFINLPMAEFIGGKVMMELVKQLFAVSNKSLRCRGTAKNLVTMIEGFQPNMKEILYSGVEVKEDRQRNLHMFSETLDKCKKLTDKVLKCSRWNMVRQLYQWKKLEDFEKKISTCIKSLLLHIASDVLHLQLQSAVLLSRIDRHCDSLTEKLGSMKLKGSEALKMEDASTGMVVGLELVKKENMFQSNHEGRLIEILRISDSGKTALARKFERGNEVRELLGGEVLMDLVKRLLAVSEKPVRCRAIAKNLATMIKDIQPNIKEGILYDGVKVNEDRRQRKPPKFFETLDKCKKLTDKVLKSKSQNMILQLYHEKKMKDLEKKISTCIKALPLHILSEIHHIQFQNAVCFNRINRKRDSLNKTLDSMKRK